MVQRRHLYVLSAVAFAALGLAGCGSKPHIAAEKYYLVATNIKIPYWQEAGAGLDKAAAELGVTASMVGPDSFDPKAEQAELRKAIAAKAAGILVSPSDPNLLVEDINAAIAAGIPVITIDSDAPNSKRLTFVGTNNHEAGLAGGKLLGSKLNGKGNVVVFTIEGQTNVAERLNGYKEALAAYPGIKIIEVIDVHGDARVAFDKTTELIKNKRDQIQAFVSLEAQSGAEVAEVLEREKVDDKLVIAMDTTGNTLEWIEKGKIAGTVSQKPYTMAYHGLRLLADLHLYKLQSLSAPFATDSRSPLPAFVDTGSTVVDKSNVAAFKQNGAKK